MPEAKPTSETSPPVVMVELGSHADRAVFGQKASTLSQLARRFEVPAGICLGGLSVDLDGVQIEALLADIWDRLNPDGTHRLIVRSSAVDEDLRGSLHAGRFHSHRDVQDLPGLIAGVRACLASSDSAPVRDYRTSLGLPLLQQEMALIIQHQIIEEFSGVAFGRCPDGLEPNGQYDFLIELTPGPAEAILAGDDLGTLFGVSLGGSMTFTHLAGDPISIASCFEPLCAVAKATVEVHRFLNEAQDLEWAWSAGKLHLLQARPIVSTVKLAEDPVIVMNDFQDVRLPNAREWGLKAAATQFFKDLEIGTRNVLIIPPNRDREAIKTVLADREIGPHGTVIRFSHGTEVGLPKLFLPPTDGPDTIAESIYRIRNDSSWVSIISDFTFVSSSFEAYVSDRCLMIEHVPGNWEPTNILTPDIFLWTESGFECFRYSGVREAVVETPGSGDRPAFLKVATRPLSRDTATDYANRALSYFRPVKERLIESLPLNVHFVADSSDRWMFLNIRPTQDLDVRRFGRIPDDEDEFKQNRHFPIASMRDVERWDGKTDLLISIATDRGQLRRIASIAKSLRERGAHRVFSTFGVLSHPAIVLREFGLEVIPIYISHDRLPLRSVARW